MQITLKSIGMAHTDADSIPRHWTFPDVEGTLVIDPNFTDGLSDITVGQWIVVRSDSQSSQRRSLRYQQGVGPKK